MKQEYIACDLCGHEEFTIIWNKVQREQEKQLNSAVIRNDKGNIVNGITTICDKCGMVCINPRMTEEETENFYKESYRNTYEVDITGEKYHAKRAVDHINKFEIVRKGMKTLDIGSASGFLVEAFNEIGCEAYGCDQNVGTSDVAKANDLKIFNNRIEDLTETGFDFVTILNTLEHMHSPSRVLRKIREILKDDGYLFIVVPNLYNDGGKISGDAFMSNAHLFHFDVDTMEQYLNVCGFDMINLTVVPEFNMDKIYVLAKKGEVKELKVDYDINPARVASRISSMDYLFMTSWIKNNRKSGGKK